jgi:hypothetical protein
MVLYPPYTVKNYQQAVLKSGYGLIFDLPPYVSESSKVTISATVNAPTLCVQIAAALVVCALLFFAFRTDGLAKRSRFADQSDELPTLR